MRLEEEEGSPHGSAGTGLIGQALSTKEISIVEGKNKATKMSNFQASKFGLLLQDGERFNFEYW
jgi:hypothetical protein